MKSICITAFALLCFAFTGNDKLTGTWQGFAESRGKFNLIFKEDKSFELLINDKPKVSGIYTLTDGIFTIEDYGCPNIVGKYKLTFFGNDDSCRFHLIEDGCDGRGSTADGIVIYKVK